MADIQWDIISGKYVASAVKAAQYPTNVLQEVAFIGRSNVGKSSLLNSLARHKGLARVSSSPGKTQTINFYEFAAKGSYEEDVYRQQFYAVDLPGYGFARTAKDNKEQWSAFICKYLENSERLRLVCQLMDIRHKPMESDIECHQWLISIGCPTMVVLTKSDKLSKSAVQAQVKLFKDALGLTEDRIIAYTSTAHTTRKDLISRLMNYLKE